MSASSRPDQLSKHPLPANDKQERVLDVGEVKSAYMRLAEAASTPCRLGELIETMRHIVGEYMPAENFYLALFDAAKEEWSIPYRVGIPNQEEIKSDCQQGLAAYVLQSGQSMLLDRQQMRQLAASGAASLPQKLPLTWLGVPLKVNGQTIGILVAQSYRLRERLTDEDKTTLRFAATQVAQAIERLRVEEALHDAEARFQAIAGLTSDFAYSIRARPNGQLIGEWVTGAFERITGFMPAELKHDVLSIIHPADLPSMMRYIKSILQGETKIAEVRIVTKHGEERWLRLYSYPIWDESQQQVLRINGTAQDITDRRLAEDALRQSEEKFRGFVEQSTNGMILLNHEGIILEWNRANEQITGLKRQQVLGRSLFEVQHMLDPGDGQTAERQERMRTLLKRMLSEGSIPPEAEPLEMHYRRPDGSQRVVQQTIFPIQTGQGFWLGVISQDVTDRKRVEQLRRANERHLILLNDITQTALQAPDLEAMLQVLADRLGELINADNCFIAFWDETQRRVFLAAASGTFDLPHLQFGETSGETGLVTKVLAAERSMVLDDLASSPEMQLEIARRFPIHSLVAVPLKAGSQKLGAILLSFQQPHAFTTEEMARCEQASGLVALAIAKACLIEETRRRAEELEALSLVSKAMRLARNRAEIPAVVLEKLFGLFQIEGAALELYDPDRHEFCVESGRGQWESWVGKRTPFDQGLSGQIMLSGQPYFNNHFHEERLCLWPELIGSSTCAAAVPLHGPEHIIGILWIGGQQPFTEKHMRLLATVGDAVASALQRQTLHENLQMQLEALRNAQARLVQSEKLAAIGQLIAGVAHELNNPLTSVLLIAQLIQEQDINPHMQKDLAKVIAEARRAANTVRGLLDFARQRPPERKPIQVNDILNTTLDLTAYELRTHRISLETHLDPNLPPTLADPHQLQQVFINLINNAWQAMSAANDRGQLIITSETGSSRFFTDKPHLEKVIRITFRDDGPGIPQELLSRIFDPFFTTKPEGIGTGLGLSICHGIISEHGGNIWVESQPGEGASFIVELPLTPAVALPGEKREGISMPSTATTGHILLIDDEASVAEVLARVLQKRGYQVETATSGMAGLGLLSESSYDLIISDIRMPEMSGPDFYRQVAAKDPSLAQRILFTTGDTVNATTRSFLEETGAPYLTKPFEVEELFERLNELLSKKKPGG